MLILHRLRYEIKRILGYKRYLMAVVVFKISLSGTDRIVELGGYISDLCDLVPLTNSFERDVLREKISDALKDSIRVSK